MTRKIIPVKTLDEVITRMKDAFMNNEFDVVCIVKQGNGFYMRFDV